MILISFLFTTLEFTLKGAGYLPSQVLFISYFFSWEKNRKPSRLKRDRDGGLGKKKGSEAGRKMTF